MSHPIKFKVWSEGEQTEAEAFGSTAFYAEDAAIEWVATRAKEREWFEQFEYVTRVMLVRSTSDNWLQRFIVRGRMAPQFEAFEQDLEPSKPAPMAEGGSNG